jgi:hypothetical protein
MKKIIALFIFVALGVSSLSFAQSLSAGVDSKQVSKNQSFNLKLELESAEPTDEPDLSPLNSSFKVLGQEQSSFTKIINGDSSSSLIWTIQLLPLRSGNVEIPSFSIHTNQGILSSQPIFLTVKEGISSSTRGNATNGISLKGVVSQSSVYQDQPIIVNYQLSSTRNLTQAQLGDLSAKDAIIEKVGEPTVKVELSHGHPMQVLNASYRVTSLKAGDLTIPPLVIQGTASAPRRVQQQPESHFPSFGDDDVFSNMRAMMKNFNEGGDLFNQFNESEPVTIASAPIVLHILPPVPGVQPWLPAQNIQLSEQLTSEQFKAGEPFELSVTTKSVGVDPSQLPSIEDQLHGDNFKVYADQPEVSASREKVQLESTKTEKFTLIPQKNGDLKIPEIKLSWWDTSKGIARVASIPERLIHVLPGTIVAQSAPEQNVKSVEYPISITIPNHSFLKLSILLLCLITIALLTRKHLFRENSIKGTSMSGDSISTNHGIGNIEIVSKKVGKKDLLAGVSVQAVKEFIGHYCVDSLSMPSGLSVSSMLEIASSDLSGSDLVRSRAMSKTIDAGLYFNTALDLDSLKRELQWLFFDRKKMKLNSSFKNQFDALNPT